MRYSREYIETMKKEIPETAFKMFAEHGIDSVTMQNIADTSHYAVASLYRYYGTKRNLVIQIAIQQWKAVAREVERAYEKLNGAGFTAYQELEFYLNSYIHLYREKKELLKFSSYFDQYIIRENPNKEEMQDYYQAFSFFDEFFHKRYMKAFEDHSIRTDIPEREVFFGMMYTMMSAASKFAYGSVYPFGAVDFTFALEMQRDAYLRYMTRLAD